MAYLLVNLGSLRPPCTATQEEIESAASLLPDLDLRFAKVGEGFLDLRGDQESIDAFVTWLHAFPKQYVETQDGDMDEDI